MGLLELSKKILQTLREDGCDSLMDEVCSFCGKHDIPIFKMDEDYTNGKSKGNMSGILYLNHFRVEVFYVVIDLARQELNSHFDVVTSELLLGMASLSPLDSFDGYDNELAKYYPSEFGDKKLGKLNSFIVYFKSVIASFSPLKRG
ncbi:hypothetical protein K7X08_012366 [Anisodus acutangulus]|uniref:Uncharacterized protein n=1 Tax=Anisodus acutangulus TaxID=402998 RepID=A0A9Q1LCR2_9SOLA|nr:hypothetical protein K7X08_012366 [Anisodus acutangulus]